MPEDIDKTLHDPDFLGLPDTEKHKVLLRIDPSYAALPGSEQQKVVGGLTPSLLNAPAAAHWYDPLAGIGAGVIRTALGSAGLFERLGTFGASREINKLAERPEVAKFAEPPPSLGGKIGYGAETLAEYLAPGPLEAKLISAAPIGLRTIARIAASAAGAGAIGAAQQGKPSAGVVPALTAGAFTGILTPSIAALGRKIQASTIRPRVADFLDGFKWSTLDRFKLKGNLEQSLNQVETELARLRVERNAMVAPGQANVDLNQAFREAESEILKEVGKLKYAGEGQKVEDALLSKIRDIRESLHPPAPVPGPVPTNIRDFAAWKAAQEAEKAAAERAMNVDIRLAENAKEHLGLLGSWANGRPDLESRATEIVANKMYLKLKDAIETSLGTQGPEVRALNKQMQELIPVKRAMLARIPVEERNRLFSLADITAMLPAIMTGDARHLTLLGLTRAQKWLTLGNLLRRVEPGEISATGRLLGGALGQVATPPPPPPE